MKALETFSTFPIDPDEQKLFDHRIKIEAAIKLLKGYKEQLDKELIQYMQGKKISSFEFGEEKVFISEKKTNRFASEKILFHLHVSSINPCDEENEKQTEIREQVIKCLPANPSFKKTEVLKLMEMTGEELFWEDIENVVQVKTISKEMLKAIQQNKEV